MKNTREVLPRRESEREYWLKLWRDARQFAVDLPDRQWCNYWHKHFDWHSRGSRSRFEHRKHIRPLMRAFARAQQELSQEALASQVFVQIHPQDPGSDALYIHTPNPHSEFPEPFDRCRFASVLPPLLMGLVSKERYRIGVSEYDGKRWYTIIPK